ncbi:MAG: PDZ domain-containing protein [Phycisphaerales bacterium]|jgi:serine protease Do|nr:PDZ domain-containing protein [Phycisphaerales bacterium]
MLKMNCFAGVVLALAVFMGISCTDTGTSAHRGDLSIDAAPAIAKAVKNVYPSLVRIYVVVNQPGGGRMRKFRAAGSGAIIDKQGYVVTNHHVAGNAKRIICSLTDRQEIEAELVGTDALSDIAVLKLDLSQLKGDSAEIPVARWGDSDKVRVGDEVFAMGSPAAVSQSVTKGIVSNTKLIMPKSSSGMFRLDGEDVGSVVRWLAHDAVIFGGNSGGPLVDANGRIIGINEIGLGSLGGAIPANVARYVAEQIIAHGYVKRSWTGMEVQPRLRSGKASSGVLVSGVIDASPAAHAGLQPGDVLTRFDGKTVDCEVPEQLPLFNQVVLGTPVGKKVNIDLIRGGKTVTLSLTTVAREAALPKPIELKSWGVTARNLSRMMALERRRSDKNGVLVGSLRPGGPCGEAKPAIQTNDIIRKVNGKAVKDIAALQSITSQATGDKTEPVGVMVTFLRGTRELMTMVKVGKEKASDKPARARKPWPAVSTQVLTRDLARGLGMEGKTGVRVTEVYPGRAGAKAGLKVGDVILTVDSESIEASQPEDGEVFETMIRQYRVGGEVVLGVRRGKKDVKIKMTLEAPPVSSDRLATCEDDNFEFTARNMSAMDKFRKKLDATLRGVLVVKVESGGWAALGGLASGDVLLSVQGQPTGDVDLLKTALEQIKAKRPRRVVFFIRRGIHTVYREIEPVWQAK